MPRVLWKGAIVFGLVNIPVGLYSAERRNELSFAMLDRRDMAPVGYKRFNKESGKEVPWDQIVKGYEYEDGRYVVFSDADFKAANVEATQTVDIMHFVDPAQIPFPLYETPYFLAPDKRGARGYVLLRETLEQARKVAVAEVVIRTRQYLAVVAPLGNVLVLNTLRFPDELRSPKELEVPEPRAGSAKPAELQMALHLVEEMSRDFDPRLYHDSYREDVMARVKQKIKAGETEVITPEEPERPASRKAEVIDLMALLKRSIEQKGRPASASNSQKVSHANGKKAARSRARAATPEKRPAAPRRKRA
jgi:DNA end-binding protein Ku